MEDKVKKFNKFENIFFKIHIGLFLFGLFLLSLLYLAQNALETISQIFLSFVVTGLYAIILNFFIGLIRLLKYLFGFKDTTEVPSIKRTIILLLSSPIVVALYFIMVFVMSLSMASCS